MLTMKTTLVIVFSFMTAVTVTSCVEGRIPSTSHEVVGEDSDPNMEKWSGVDNHFPGFRPLLDNMIESDPYTVGQNGELGCYQLSYDLWKDACELIPFDTLVIDDGFESCINREYSEKVIVFYFLAHYSGSESLNDDFELKIRRAIWR